MRVDYIYWFYAAWVTFFMSFVFVPLASTQTVPLDGFGLPILPPLATEGTQSRPYPTDQVHQAEVKTVERGYVPPLAAAQVLAPFAKTKVTFIGLDVSTPYDSVTYGRLGAVWAGMPGPYNTPIECRCARPGEHVRIRLRFRGVGGIHVVIASGTLDDKEIFLAATTDIDFPPGRDEVLAVWDVDGPVVFSFGPNTNMRGVFIDSAPVPNGGRIQIVGGN